ncbi:MAG TPA: hypothetical protein DCZ01_06990 [Elusimicrobia bacterium]|nr:MAG: hypothetical protein A2X37_01800 [Elusimicrobia bacterium GWA2_66_18]OGR73086.1 MAG: hypothetical protein A2X40_11975 [Elusimicrobia bacterium GWC2_65_9]HAZ08253.1 hypothetical protein [Elusimicrobiota bacterium]
MAFFSTPKRLKPLILHIDDSEDVLMVTEVMLKQVGLDVIGSPRPDEMIPLAEKHGPDLILLDVLMPDVSGYIVCRRLKDNAKTKAIPVIMATSEDTVKDIEKALSYYGANEYIIKPFTVEKLKAKIAKFLTLPDS